MDSPMLKMLKAKNPDTDYPTNMGQKWTTEEENILLQELDKNINIEIIAQTHNRSVGGIIGRQRTIAYNMCLENVSIEEIIKKTKLNKEQIMETITKKTNDSKKVKVTSEPNKNNTQTDNIFISINKKDYTEIKNSVKEMKTEIKELRKTLTELVEMMKAVYEFEDS